MSENPKKTPNTPVGDLVQFSQALLEFLDEPRTARQREEAEAGRKMAAHIIDAKHGVQAACESRRDIIDRHLAGEDISPEVITYTGEVLLAAEMEAHRSAQQEELPFDSPPR